MTKTEIIQKKNDNTDIMHLYKKGMFYRAREKSADIFTEQLKDIMLYQSITRI